LPETPKPPVIDKAPEVDEVEFVFERTATDPTKVDVPWTDIPEAAEIVLATLSPVPIVIFPETPKPPTIFKAPVVEDIEFVLERIETAPTKVDVLCTLRPKPILAEPDTLNPLPPIISPLTPKPPVIDSAPEVDEVELVLERIETAPTRVDVPCIEIPAPILTIPDILNPVPPIISPLTPSPPVIDSAPEVDEIELVFERIATEPTNVDVP
jgi:hypothetical protein